MSVEAISWALNLAPIPLDPSGKPNSACAFVLVGLANHASPDGTGAFPSVPTLIRYTRLSERTIRTALDRLEADGVIRPCNPAIVAAHIQRADKRPQGWNLNLRLLRDDLADDSIAALEGQYPGLTSRVQAAREVAKPPACDGVQPLHPVAEPGDSPDGVQLLHPVPGTGCNWRRNGVQLAQERGATVAPEPSFEPSLQPSLKRPSRSEPASQSQNGGPEAKNASGPQGRSQDADGPPEAAPAKPRAAKPKRPKAERTPEQQAIFDEADRITTGWWDYLKRQGVTVMDSRQFLGCRESIVERALTRGATADQVKKALAVCGIPFPPVATFERALVAVQTGRGGGQPGQRNGGRPSNAWVDPDATQEERDRLAGLWEGVSIMGRKVELS
jgi:hypothetical protein